MTPAGPRCLVHDHEDLLNYLADGDVSKALRAHNRHFDQIEKSLMLDGRSDRAGDLSAVSELAEL
jgi:DNA-binding GntR family transcriptional regulator